jgi:hypothetical protein
MSAIGPWVQDCIRLMDSDGAYAHFKEHGELGDQPFLDMQIYDVIRSVWCELRNKEMEAKFGKNSIGNH